MTEVVIVGAGPAGAVAATVLARAGVRVRLVDRAAFPRAKLCGDTLNPGALAVLRRLGLADAIDAQGLRVDGMLITGEGGVVVEARYPRNLHGRAITRAHLDWALIEQAVKAGAEFETGVTVRGAVVDDGRGERRVSGIRLGGRGGVRAELRAAVTIAADGRRSALARGLGLVRYPRSPRRWALGVYFDGVERASEAPLMGEMHIRRGRYIGVAPVAGGRTNVCLVKPSSGGDPDFRDPMATLRAALAAEPLLADRFRRAEPAGQPVLLGPLAVEAAGRSIDGLIVAGDAAGFVDPMTGDGMHFAIRGGELAAEAALRALEQGWSGVHANLRRARERDFASKRRFNRVLRSLVASPPAVRAAASAASLMPIVLRAVVARAGDCHRAG